VALFEYDLLLLLQLRHHWLVSHLGIVEHHDVAITSVSGR
jgi:hypothetical protein